MTASPAERAVIEAARAFRAWANQRNERALFDAVRALDAVPPSIEDFLSAIADMDANSADRPHVAARACTIAGYAMRRRLWDVKNAADIAALPVYDIRDQRNAGVAVWRVWADALRSLGLEPTWAAAVGVPPTS